MVLPTVAIINRDRERSIQVEMAFCQQLEKEAGLVLLSLAHRSLVVQDIRPTR